MARLSREERRRLQRTDREHLLRVERQGHRREQIGYAAAVLGLLGGAFLVGRSTASKDPDCCEDLQLLAARQTLDIHPRRSSGRYSPTPTPSPTPSPTPLAWTLDIPI